MISNARGAVADFNFVSMFGTAGIRGSLNIGQQNQTDISNQVSWRNIPIALKTTETAAPNVPADSKPNRPF